jgi:hypothetical protein
VKLETRKEKREKRKEKREKRKSPPLHNPQGWGTRAAADQPEREQG